MPPKLAKEHSVFCPNKEYTALVPERPIIVTSMQEQQRDHSGFTAGDVLPLSSLPSS